MNIQLIKAVLLMVFCLGTGSKANAQGMYKLTSGGQSMKMSGTSTLHKWTMKSNTFNGNAQFGFEQGGAKMSSLQSLSFSLPVLTLKSGEKGLDKNAYKALKTAQHANILYKLTSAIVTMKAADNYIIKTHGDLSIAGVTKDVAMDVYCRVNADKSITCTGRNQMNMSDYNVTPPKFMGGAMKTGDAITLDFTLVYKQ